MDLVIVAFYTVCDDLLIQHGYQDDPRTQMSAAEVMTYVGIVGLNGILRAMRS